MKHSSSANGSPSVFDCPGVGLTQQGLRFGEGLFDRIDVRQARHRRAVRDRISRALCWKASAEGAHAVLLLDRAGWHTTGKLDLPDNITPIFLPSRAPELNPVENVWQYLRQHWLSNTVFENYDAIVDAACAAWRNLIAQPQTIASIGMREWAHVGQSL